MAAPTNVRVYADSQTTAVLKWSYAGTLSIAVYRSTDGVSYSQITASVTPTALTYTDTGLSIGTKYWYKLSEDLGANFSSIVTVYTHECLPASAGDDNFALPRTSGGEVESGEFDEMAERIENALNGRVLSSSQCAVCPDDGRIIIDCSTGCRDFVLVADEDVNSISIQWCGEGTNGINIDVVLPPNTSGRKVCGWPAGIGFTGDECFSAPVSSGVDGKTISVGVTPGGKVNPGVTSSKSGTSSGIGRGGSGGGGAACACVTNAAGALTIKSCTAGNSLGCSGAKSLRLLVCGGRPPYTWSKTGSVRISKATGETTTVTPPANTGSTVAGVAYRKGIESVACGHVFGTTHSACGLAITIYGCDDVKQGVCTTLSDGLLPQTYAFAFNPSLGGPCGCGEHSGHVMGPCTSGASVVCTLTTADECTLSETRGATMDRRTAPMIAAGCTPCALSEGDTVSVTDAVGTIVTVIIKA